MISLHVGMLLGALAEVWLLGRPFLLLLAWPMLVIALAYQAGHFWIIRSLDAQRRSAHSGSDRVRPGACGCRAWPLIRVNVSSPATIAG